MSLIPRAGLKALLSGGISYSVGVAFFLWSSLPFNHCIWHLYVLAGSAFHYYMIYILVVLPKRMRTQAQKVCDKIAEKVL